MPYWLLAAIAYALCVGSVGITGKLAMRTVSWPILLLSTTTMYALASIAVLATRSTVWPSFNGRSIVLVAMTGIFPMVSFVLLMTAVRSADASRVVPITAAYPIVTAVLAALVLQERLGLTRLLGTILIILGGVLVAR